MNNLAETTTINVNGLEKELYKINDEGAAPMVAYIPDLHVSTTTLNNVIYEAANDAKGYERVYISIAEYL